MSAPAPHDHRLGSSEARAARLEWAGLALILALLGLLWGSTQALAKISVSGGYRHLGILVWVTLFSALFLGAVLWARGTPIRTDHRALRFYLWIAVIGTVVPGIASYEAARHLPAGWLSLLISTVPLFAFPVALALGIDRFAWARAAGLAVGLAGVVVLAAPWDAGAVPVGLGWVFVAIFAPFCYAIEGNSVAYWGTGGLDPVQLLFGASLASALLAAPLALGTGTWIDPRPPWSAPDLAILLTAAVHATAYAGYVWLVGRAGAVFAAQVAYLVAGFGVLWALLLLGESYGPRFWLALACMFAGLTLVRPRSRPRARPTD